MRTHARLAVWMLVIMALALGLTGCFRSAGDDLDPTPQSGAMQGAGGATNTSQPTSDSASPTAEDLTPLASPVGSPTLTPFPTFAAGSATETTAADGQGGPLVTPESVLMSTNTPLPTIPPTTVPQATVAIQSTYTPLPTYTQPPSSTPLPTYTPLATNTPQPTYTPLPSSTPSPTKRPVIGPTLTFTPVPFMTFAPSPTYTPYKVSGLAAPVEAQPLAERPPEQVNADTSFGTGGPDNSVAVAAVVTPTPTPVINGVPQGGGTPPDAAVVAQQATAVLSPGQMTATMIVFEATATIAALTGTPIATPIPPIDGQGGQIATQAPAQPIVAGQFPPNATVITATPYGQGGICAEHTISLGETLYSIARRYGVTAAQIQALNPALIPTVDLINAGDKIAIPCAVTPTPTPQPVPVVSGTTADGQGGFAATPGVATGNIIHVVVVGDTLFSIARQYGVDIFDLMAANGYTQATMNYLYEGDEVVVPNQPITTTTTTGTTTTTQGIAPTLTPYIIIVTPVGQ